MPYGAILQSTSKRRPDRKPPKPPIEPDPVLNALTYILGVESSVSAGIYKIESGEYKMLRNLISNRRMAPETYTEPWDFKDNDGNLVPAGTYPVLLQTNDLKYEFEGTIGNTSTEKIGASRHKSFQFAVHMAIHGTTGYYCTNYTELFTNTHRFNTASPQSRTAIHEKYKTLQMTKYVATDGTLVYSCGADPVRITKSVTSISIGNPGVITGPANTFFDFRTGDKITVLSANGGVLVGGNSIVGQSFTITKISETQVSIGAATTGTAATSGSVQSAFKSFTFANKVSDNSEHKGFTSVTPVRPTHGGGLTFTHAIDYIQGGEEVLPTGCALSGNYYFVARGGMNSIRVLNKTTGAFVREITTFTNPRELEADYIGNLWIIHGTNNVTKHTVNSDGTLSAATLTLTGINKALFLAASKDGSKIYVGDQFGASFTIRCYNNSTGAYINSLGNGESVTNPEVKNNKFFLADINNGVDNTFKGFAECDDDGNIWVGDAGNSRIQKFSSAYVHLDTIMWLPHSYSVTVDKANPYSVFNEWKEFDIDYDYPLLPNNNSWVFVRNFAGSIPAGYYRDYTRDVLTSVVTVFGRTYGFLKHTTTFKPIIVELLPDGPMRLTPKEYGVHAKVYFNADGSVTRVTDVVNGVQTVYNQPMTGVDGSNNPVWGTEVVIDTITGITGTDPVDRGGAKTGQKTTSGKLVYFDREGEQNGHGQGYHLGIRKGGNWLVKTSKATGKNYTGDFPNDDRFDTGNNVNAAGAGGDLFVNGNDIIYNYIGEFWKNAQANFGKHFSDNGLLLGTFGTWKKNFNQESHAELQSRRLDGSQPTLQALAGNAFSGGLARVGDNLYFYYNDESLNGHSGIHRVKISGFDTIDTVESTITVPEIVIPDPEGPPVNIRIGFNTSNEFTAWKNRYTAKNKFFAKSDIKTNSPGIVGTLTEMANALQNNPLIDRFTGPTYYNSGGSKINYSGSYYIHQNSYPEPGNKGSRVKAAAILYAAGETKYLNAIKTAILDFIAQPINQFPAYEVDWPANGTMWKPNVIGDINPLFIYAQYFKKYIEAYNIIKASFSSSQRTAIEDCYYKFCLFAAKEVNADMSVIWTNRNPVSNKHATGYVWNGDWKGSQRKMFDGTNTPKASLVSLYLNNRRLEIVDCVVLMGILKNDDYLLSSAYVFVKEWLKYGCYPWNGEVLPGELERASEGGFNDKGVSYSLVQVGLATHIAHAFEVYANANYPSLFSYSTTEGYSPSGGYSSEGGPKSILRVGKSVLKLPAGELVLTYNGVRLDAYRESPLWHFTEDTTLAAALYAYSKDPWFEKSALRAHPGSRPFPAGGNGSGAYKPYEGFGGGDWWLFTRFFPGENVNLY